MEPHSHWSISPLQTCLWFYLLHIVEVLVGWKEQELVAFAWAALVVMSHNCFGRSPLRSVTQACLWGMQQLKHQLTDPPECTVTSEGFRQVLPVTSPSTASRIKAWCSELGDIREHLLKEAQWGMVTVRPAVEINIIGVRLHFIRLKTCLLPPEKSISTFKVTLIWNIPHTELPVTCLQNNHAILFS